MILTTKRLILRPWEDGDAADLYQYAKDERVGPMAGWAPHKDEEDSLMIIRTVLSQPETYAVVPKETGRPVGSVGIHQKSGEKEAEIGCWIGVPYWGQGLIPEAVRRLVRRCFEELHCETVWYKYYDGNEKSRRVQEKCGFSYHHIEKQKLTLLGDRRDTHVCCLTRQAYEAQNRKAADETGLLIRTETPADARAVEELTREAFWNVYRPGCMEHYLVHRFRGRPECVQDLNLVMEQNGVLIGHILYVKAAIELDQGGVFPVMTFGPVSIVPAYQRRGYGKKLVTESLKKARALGAKAVCMEGNLDFYGKVGFVKAGEKGIRYGDAPQGEEVPYFLIKELVPGALDGITGVYHTPEGYFVDEEEVERFDAGFPKKKKEKRPGQLV